MCVRVEKKGGSGKLKWKTCCLNLSFEYLKVFEVMMVSLDVVGV